MTTGIANHAKSKVVDRLMEPDGVNAALTALAESGSPAPVMLTQHVAADLGERSVTLNYPLVTVYCEKIANDLREKFRSFSGTVQMAVEIRHSQDRLEGIEDGLELYT